MKYDFDSLIPRRGSDSIKWKKYPDDVLPLWVADMDFPSHPRIVDAMTDRLAHPCFGYGCGDDELYGVICDWAAHRYGWEIQPEWLMFVPGVVTGMNWAIQALIGKDQTLYYQTPVYPPFLNFAANAGVKAVEIPLRDTSDRYEIDFEDFERSIQWPGVFALCNPHNPVGRVFSEAELTQLAQICLEKGVRICSDEIHCDLIYSDQRHISIASISGEIAANTITLMAPSKTFNIPGLEFSFAIVPNPELRKRMENSRRGLVGHLGILAFPAAKAAYQYGEEWLDELMVYLEGNRDHLYRYLADHIPAIQFHQSQGTYLAWLDCRELNLKKDACEFFLDEARVALNNGADFGKAGEGFVRLNFGTPRSNLMEALSRMKDAVEKSG
jgi:cysteine-S-conjugate beta-lyase